MRKLGEEEDELRLDSWIQIRSTGWDKRKLAVQCSWLEDYQHTIEEPCETQGGEEAGGVEGQPGEKKTVVREQRE